ncbi:hypothetical protein ACI79V_06285 [Geodermatophilus sp. SYSU D00700]
MLNLTWGAVGKSSFVFVAIGEGAPGGGRFIGSARYTVHNVAPSEGRVSIWANIEYYSPIRRLFVGQRLDSLKDGWLHTLQHRAAGFLLAAGTHTKVVREHLAHSPYVITADIYSHVGTVQQREVANRLDQVLRRRPWLSARRVAVLMREAGHPRRVTRL